MNVSDVMLLNNDVYLSHDFMMWTIQQLTISFLLGLFFGIGACGYIYYMYEKIGCWGGCDDK